MLAIKIKITNYISDAQPGFVETEFFDAWNSKHIVQEKVPVVTDKYLDLNSKYPQDGIIACEFVKEWIDNKGRTILTVNTEKPWGVDSIEGKTEFDMLKEQLTELER